MTEYETACSNKAFLGLPYDNSVLDFSLTSMIKAEQIFASESKATATSRGTSRSGTTIVSRVDSVRFGIYFVIHWRAGWSSIAIIWPQEELSYWAGHG